MQFSHRIDKDLPADTLFDAASDFNRIERMLLRRGVSVTRVGEVADAAQAWDIAFDWRGQRREVRLVLVQFDRPEKMVLTGRSDPFDLKINLSVVALSRQKSRLSFVMEAKPRNMRARLTIQTAKLGRAQLNRKFAKKISSFVDDAIARI